MTIREALKQHEGIACRVAYPNGIIHEAISTPLWFDAPLISLDYEVSHTVHRYDGQDIIYIYVKSRGGDY